MPNPHSTSGAGERNYELEADGYKWRSGKASHTLECATSCAPAMEPGPCDCEVQDNRVTVTESLVGVLREVLQWMNDYPPIGTHGTLAMMQKISAALLLAQSTPA